MMKIDFYIFGLVSYVTGVEIKQIRSKSRKAEYVDARHVCCYLLRKKGYTCDGIGKMINRSHSSVVHAVNRVDVFLSNNDSSIVAIIQKINEYEKCR